MTVRLYLFAIFREIAHVGELSLALPSAATVATAIAEFARRYPAARAHLASCRVAVNERFADADQPLCEGDELALIPPVAGG